ncbi:MAG: UDP-N-acetylmuramoyl-L-alanine--D-glutamate ligase, partial [Clostridiales bacterium]|jgi:UDP-N-acetylmuramoylalanine--D-glutamate ligase|nr:UDP-N-acetylmuramoyl-L-alanine--D-glutamate ligase [Clostridiales bacterium]
LRHGAQVTLTDTKNAPQIDAELLKNENVSTYFGKTPDDIVSDFDIVVISPGISVYSPFVDIARRAGAAVVGEIEIAAAVCKAPIIAVTGTNGKTTTVSMAGNIMQIFAKSSRVVGNIGLPFCDVAEDIAADAFAVAEISSFQLETIADFRPKISAVLNMTQDHLDRHITMENYIAAKERIFENQRPDDFCILNYDNEITRNMAAKTAAQVIFFSKRPMDAGVFVKDGAICVSLGSHCGEIMKLEDLPTPGTHNLENAMAAAAMAAAAGVPTDTIAEGLRGFRAVEHRLEHVRGLRGVDFYNDSKATNVDSAIMGIDAMSRPVILIGGGQGKGQNFDRLIAAFGGKVKSFVMMGEAAQQLAETCQAHNFAAYKTAADMQDAVNIAFAQAVEGDCVLLSPACASMDMFDDFEHRGNVFKAIVRKLQ